MFVRRKRYEDVLNAYRDMEERAVHAEATLERVAAEISHPEWVEPGSAKPGNVEWFDSFMAKVRRAAAALRDAELERERRAVLFEMPQEPTAPKERRGPRPPYHGDGVTSQERLALLLWEAGDLLIGEPVTVTLAEKARVWIANRLAHYRRNGMPLPVADDFAVAAHEDTVQVVNSVRPGTAMFESRGVMVALCPERGPAAEGPEFSVTLAAGDHVWGVQAREDHARVMVAFLLERFPQLRRMLTRNEEAPDGTRDDA
jgi:hypothetical protein